MIKLYRISILFILAGFVAAQSAAQNKLVFIYKSDSTEAHLYKTLLQPYGIETALLDVTKVSTYDFSPFNLIISGSNSSSTWSAWNTNADVAAIKASKKPILALCREGSGLLYKIGAWNNGGNAASNGFGEALKVLHPEDKMYNIPYQIKLNADSTFNPFVHTSCGSYMFTANGYPKSVNLYDRSNIAEFKSYSGFVVDSAKYYYLGYGLNDAISDFTAEGQKFFVNIIYNAGNFNIITEIQEEANATDKISFYPNPGNGIFNIESKEIFDQIEVFSIAGDRMYMQNSQKVLDLSILNNGVYIVKAKSGNNVQVSKIIIE